MRHSPLGQRPGLRFVRPAIVQQSHKYRIAFMPQGSLGQRYETRQRCLSFKRSSPGSMPQGEPPWPLWQLTFHPGEPQKVKKATTDTRSYACVWLPFTCWGVRESLRPTKVGYEVPAKQFIVVTNALFKSEKNESLKKIDIDIVNWLSIVILFPKS